MHRIDNMAGIVIDFYDDPDFMKTASEKGLFNDRDLMSPEKAERLPDYCFAVKIAGNKKIKRAFPINTEMATKFSSMYLDAVKDTLPKSAVEEAYENIKKAANEFGLEIDTISIPLTFPTEDPTFIFKTAADNLIYQLDFMDPIDRVFACTKLAANSEEYNIKLDPRVEDYVYQGKVGSYFVPELCNRHNLVGRIDNPMVTGSWEHTLKKLGTADSVQEMITRLELFDKTAGINHLWGKEMRDPYASVLGGKTASKTPTQGEYPPDPEIGTPEFFKRRVAIFEAAARLARTQTRSQDDPYLNAFLRDPISIYESDKTPKELKRKIDKVLNEVTKAKYSKVQTHQI